MDTKALVVAGSVVDLGVNKKEKCMFVGGNVRGRI
jgi:hypothetical protein